jgi:hypothetical protein
VLFLSTVVLHISAFVCTRNVICIADYQLSPWHVSLIIRALWYCHHDVRYFADYHISLLHSSLNMFCWLSSIAITCFADYQNFVTVNMVSDNSLIIRAVCSLFRDICLVHYQLSPLHVSLIITSLCYLVMASDISLIIRFLCSILHEMSCWFSALAVTRFADYHSSVPLLP